MSFDFGEIENTGDFYDANYTLTIKDRIRRENMPDNISSQMNFCNGSGSIRGIKTTSFPDSNAMTEIVAQTCMAEYHKRKGYIDSVEESAITFNELLKLFRIKLHRSTNMIADIIIELEDCFIYIYSGKLREKIVINPADFKAPSDDRIIVYVYNQDIHDRLTQEREYFEQCEKIFERLTEKKSKKPILIFHWVDSIIRNDVTFPAPDILNKLGENGFEKILCFQGVYNYRNTLKSGLIYLIRKKGTAGIRYDVVRLKTIEEYLEYWDWIFKSWIITGRIPSCEAYWEDRKIKLLPMLMPAPYIGDPYRCSAVILNYNPGSEDYDIYNKDIYIHENEIKRSQQDPQHHNKINDPETICGHMAHRYRDAMKCGEYFDFGNIKYPEHRDGQNEGPKWWKSRKDWIDVLIQKDGLNPFGLEICGWHSNKWDSISFPKNLLESLKNRLAKVIEEAINNSELGIGIAVGAGYGNTLLPHFGYVDVTEDIMCGKNLKNVLNSNRSYRIFKNDNDIYIINTWVRSYNPMDVPDVRFRNIEHDIINKINDARLK